MKQFIFSIITLALASTSHGLVTVTNQWLLGEDGALAAKVGAADLTATGTTTDGAAVATGSTVSQSFTNTFGAGAPAASNYASATVGIGSTNNWGVSMWINPTTLPNASQGEIALIQVGSINLEMIQGGWMVHHPGSEATSVTSGVPLPALNTPFQVSYVNEGGTARLYVNGSSAGVFARNSGNNVLLGAMQGNIRGFNGLIDEVTVFTFDAGQFRASDLDTLTAAPTDPVIVMPATPVSAGTVAVNTTGTANVDIKNGGAANTLTISAVSGLSGDFANFTLVTPLPLNILPTETGTLEFTYTPGATAASHNAVFTVTNNDANNPNPTVTLTGTAITDPNMDVPSTLAFGTVASTVTTTKTIRVRNTAFTNDLNISLAISGTDAGKFSIIYPDPPTAIAIKADSFEDVQIACNPGTALGALSATLDITHDDPDQGSPVAVALTADSAPRYSEIAHYLLGESDADLTTTLDDAADYDLTNINGTPGTSYNSGSGTAGSTKGIDNALDDVYSYTGVPTELAGRTQNWGMETWIRPELATGSGQIGGGYGGMYLGVGSGSRGGFSIFSLDGSHWGLNIGGITAVNSVVPIQGGTWTHVAAVALDNQIRLYVNGVLAHTYSGLGYAPNDTGGQPALIELGGQVANSWRTAGGVDEARIFSFVSGQFNPATDLHVTPPADADGDGLLDIWEDKYFGNNDGTVTWAELTPTDGSGDADTDTFTDKQEHDAGTDPQDENSFPSTEPLSITSITKVGNTATVNFKGVDGKTYHLKKSLTLADGFPTDCGSVTLSGTDTGTLQDTNATEAKAFYRVERP